MRLGKMRTLLDWLRSFLNDRITCWDTIRDYIKQGMIWKLSDFLIFRLKRIKIKLSSKLRLKSFNKLISLIEISR
jgi:hypothetical protein